MKYLFVGSRLDVLNRMLELNLDIVKILIQSDTYAEKALLKKEVDFVSFNSKSDLLHMIEAISYDILVSNGCPYILPISKLKKKKELFINIHPSLLPDLRGFSPINGAILFGRTHGVTCHIMDDDIDTGDIISQIKLDITDEMDLPLIYQLTFMAEADVFEKAFKNNFSNHISNKSKADLIYYSRKEEDQKFVLSDKVSEIHRKIRAFGIKTQRAFFEYKRQKYYVLHSKTIRSEYLEMIASRYMDYQVVRCFDDNILIKIREQFVLFEGVSTRGKFDIKDNSILFDENFV